MGEIENSIEVISKFDITSMTNDKWFIILWLKRHPKIAMMKAESKKQ